MIAPPLGVNVDRAGRQVLQRLLDELDALKHLLHPHQVTGVAVAAVGTDDLEIEVRIGEIRLVFPQITEDAAGPGQRSRATEVDRVLAS
jgi:hypothetical protein